MKINISNRIDYVNEDSMLLTALTMNGMNALAQSRYRVEKACHIVLPQCVIDLTLWKELLKKPQRH